MESPEPNQARNLHDLLQYLPYHLFHDKIASRLHPTDVHNFRSACKSTRDYTAQLASARRSKNDMLSNNRSVILEDDVWILMRRTTSADRNELGVVVDMSVRTEDIQPGLIDELERHVADFDINRGQEAIDMSVWVSLSSGTIHINATEAMFWDIYTDSACEIWDDLSIGVRHAMLSAALARLGSAPGDAAIGAFRPGMDWKTTCANALKTALAKLRPVHEMQLGSVLLNERMSHAENRRAASTHKPTINVSAFNSNVSYSSGGNFHLYGKLLSQMCVELKVHSPFYSVSVIVTLNGNVMLCPCFRGSEARPTLPGQRAIADLDPGTLEYVLRWAQLKLDTACAQHVTVIGVECTDSEIQPEDISFFLARARASFTEQLKSL